MRMAELSRRTGVPVPTIKYYLREGLLPPGERTSPNQAQNSRPDLKALASPMVAMAAVAVSRPTPGI